MSKKINLSISILCLIEVICMFTPLCLIRKYWEYEKSSVYHGIASVKSRVGINNFEVGSTFGKILAILFLCAAIITAIIYLLNALDKKSALCHKGWLISTIHTIVMSAFLIEDQIIMSYMMLQLMLSQGRLSPATIEGVVVHLSLMHLMYR